MSPAHLKRDHPAVWYDEEGKAWQQKRTSLSKDFSSRKGWIWIRAPEKDKIIPTIAVAAVATVTIAPVES